MIEALAMRDRDEPPPAEWPAEPWVLSPDIEERGCIFQEGEVDAIAIVDVNRENSDEFVHDTARRIVECINALQGVTRPEELIKLCRKIAGRFHRRECMDEELQQLAIHLDEL